MDRIEQEHNQIKIDFDADGPHVSGIRLHRSSASFDIERFERGLISIARAMEAGELGLAGIAAARLPLPRLTEAALTDMAETDRLFKAGVDDPDHPGYPKGEPDGKGGQFRPKDAEPGNDNGPLRPAGTSGLSRAERLERLQKRRGLRATLRRVLTFKRAARLVGENALAAATEALPVIDVVTDAAAFADDAALVSEIAAYRLDTEAAVAFVDKGPLNLADLQVSSTERSFPFFPSFKKKDEIAKFFGEAGDGMDYHHIVEQGAIGDTIAATEVNSTGNIVRIPRLLHEEINSIYATPRLLDGKLISPRDLLKGKSFKEQYDFGIDALKSVGVLH